MGLKFVTYQSQDGFYHYQTDVVDGRACSITFKWSWAWLECFKVQGENLDSVVVKGYD